MRVLLSTIGSRGDVQPLAALALALKGLGADPHLCVPPDFCGWLDEIGLTATPIGPVLRRPAAPAGAPASPPAPLTPEQRRQLAEASVAAQFETVAAAAAGCGVLVAASALQIAARSVAERIGIPYVFAAYCPNVLPSEHHAPPPLPLIPGQPPLPASASHRERWDADAARSTALFGPALNAHRAALGMPAVTDVRSHVFGERPWLAADPVLAPWPEPDAETVFQPGAWILPDERPLPGDVNAFLDEGEPPIYFGFGSMTAPGDVAGTLLGAARALGRRAIVSRGWADLAVADDAADAIGLGEANLRGLFPRVAVVVHHGGAGTTTLAALAGVPQVVVPQIYDQHYWAARVEALGIGVAHAPGVPDRQSLTAALERALRPEVAERAATLSARVSREGAVAAAKRLMALA